MSIEFQNNSYKTPLDIQKEADATVEELQYMSSSNYQNFQLKMNSMDTEIVILLSNLKKKYQERKQYFNDIYCKDLSESILIQGIGFPIPEKFVEEMKQIITLKLETVFAGNFNFKVDIIPEEYIMTEGNVAKKVDQYEAKVSIRELEKEPEENLKAK